MKEKMLSAYKNYEDIKDAIRHETWITYGIIDDKDKETRNSKKEPEEKQLNLSQIAATISHIKFCEETEASIRDLGKESNSLILWYGLIFFNSFIF